MLKVTLPSAYEDRHRVKDSVERLMGPDPAPRFAFVQSRRRRWMRKRSTLNL
jgi:topoisomerase IV subunit B